jgi:dihydrofolate reductase
MSGMVRSCHGIVVRRACGRRDPAMQLHVWGSGNLVRTLAQHDLVDEYLLWFYPVVLGGGKRLFEPGFTPGSFELVGSKRTRKGATVNRYRRAGKVKQGSFARES